MVNYWDKYTEMHGQQNVKITQDIYDLISRYKFFTQETFDLYKCLELSNAIFDPSDLLCSHYI